MRFGLASCDITPDRPVFMAGYAARTERSQGCYLPLLGRVLVLEDGERRLVWVTADLICFCDVTAPRLQEAVAAACGVPPEWVLLSASHTHCGPALRAVDNDLFGPDTVDGIDDLVLSRLTSTAAAACSSLRAGQVRYGRGHSTMGVCRRGLVDGQTAMVPNPDGLMDPEVAVLRLDEADGRPGAAIVSYACHPTTMGGQLLGPDYIGYLRLAVEHQIGAPMLFWQGCGGDVKPRNLTPDGRFASGPLSAVERCGRELAEAAIAALSGPLAVAEGPLDSRRCELSLPFQPVQPRAVYEAAAASGDRWLKRWGAGVLAALDSGAPLPAGTPFTVQRVTIGDQLGIIALSGEVCCGIGLRLKAELAERWPQPIVIAYTGAVLGYQAAAAQFPAGGYEVEGWSRYRTIPAPYQPDIEDRIVAAALSLEQPAPSPQPRRE